MADKLKTTKVMSPKGRAIYPKLDKPDTKYDAAGTYSVKLSVPATAVADIQATLQDVLDAFVEAKKAELLETAGTDKKKLVIVRKKIDAFKVAEIFPVELDDEGAETENVIMAFKMKASGVTKAGKAWTRKPSVFDAKGKSLKVCPPVWGGSILKVSGEALPYYMASTDGLGVTIYMEGVQILDLKTGSNRDAADFGFGEEEGFSANETDGEFSDETDGGDGDEPGTNPSKTRDF